MSQVHIGGPEHTVTVDHNGGDLAYVIEKAQKLWDDTRPPQRDVLKALGFRTLDSSVDHAGELGMSSA